jgi:cell division protein FtsB
MAKKNKKNIFSKLFFSKYFFILILIIIFSFGGIFIKKYDETKNIDNDLEDLKTEIENLEKDNEDLGKLIEYFNSSFFVEKEAREKLGFKKDGEKVMVIKNANYNDNYKENTDQNDEKIMKAMPLVWWDYFFGKSYGNN